MNGVNGQPLTIYRQITGMDERGNVVAETRGGVIDISRRYDPRTGRLKTIDGVHKLTGAEVQDLDYRWDRLGNLTRRQERSGRKNLTENFRYDGLNRLTRYQHFIAGTGQAAKTVTYDALGNITRKSDVGSYSYGSSSALRDSGSVLYGDLGKSSRQNHLVDLHPLARQSVRPCTASRRFAANPPHSHTPANRDPGRSCEGSPIIPWPILRCAQDDSFFIRERHSISRRNGGSESSSWRP